MKMSDAEQEVARLSAVVARVNDELNKMSDVVERLGQCSQWEAARLPWPLFVGEVADDEEA